MSSVLEQIRALLIAKAIPFKAWEHKPTYTSEQAAAVRGEDIKIGAKAMVLKADSQFIMCVLSAAKRIDSKKVRELTGARNVRFANREELLEKTACESGGVPPFGNLFNLPVYIDKSLLENEFIAFNAGSVTDSMSIATKDYLTLVQGEVADFST